MKILHVCVKDNEVRAEITEGDRRPQFISIDNCDTHFTLKLSSEHIASTNGILRPGVSTKDYLERTYSRFFQSLTDQGFTITPPNK